MANQPIGDTFMKQGIRWLVAAALVLALPGAALAAPCAGFADVDDSSPFCSSVAWMKNESITLGCGDGSNYCPDAAVSRLAMAAFMKRLADALFPLGCAAGQVMKWNGVDWTCADDNIGGSGGGGTVTSVAANNGLQATPNPITGSGVIGIAPAFRLPQTCANGQVAKSNGGSNGWACGDDLDTNAGGTVTSLSQGSGIVLAPNPVTTTGTIAADTTFLQRRVTGTCPADSSIRAIDALGNVTCETDDTGPANAFVHGGNAFGTTAVLGTNDNHALNIHVNIERAMRYEPNGTSPNVVGGYVGNSTAAGINGATIAGGGAFTFENQVGAIAGTVGGGRKNRANAFASTVSGGLNGVAGTDYSTVAGGLNNQATGSAATVGGGFNNIASGYVSVVAGGDLNEATSQNATIGGGYDNTVAGGDLVANGTIGGGVFNVVTGFAGTIAGGHGNQATNEWTSMGGGGFNVASGRTATVAGGEFNTASGPGATIGGGGWNGSVSNGNLAAGNASTIGGGHGNDILADGHYGTIAGGSGNQITAAPGTNLALATIGGGYNNKVMLGGGTVSGGNTNTASGFDATVGGGAINVASGPGATVPGGNSNAAAGAFSFAAGYRAKANANGCFVWNDNTNTDLVCADDNRYLARASGGYYLYSNAAATAGVYVAAGGGSWSNLSDGALKEHVADIDAAQLLERLLAMPVTSWAYRSQDPSIRHVGPMAQDFHAAFGLGESERHIGTLDAIGVSFAAIQGLNAKLEAKIAERDAQIARLNAKLDELRQAVEALARR